MSVTPTALVALVMSAPSVMAIDPSHNWLAYIIGAGGGVGLITLFITTGRDLLKGRVQAREHRDASLVLQRDTAWKERDDAEVDKKRETARANCEARNARKLWDYAARLRRQLLLAGIEPEVQEPDLEQCDLPPEH